MWYRATLDRGVVCGAARLHFLNAAEERATDRSFGRLPPSFIAPNGVDDCLLKTPRGLFRRQHPVWKDKKLVVFMGRLHPVKNLPLLLAAFDQVASRVKGAHCLLVGPDAGEWRKLAEQADAMGLKERVHWLGPIHGPERFELLADADVFVLTSHNEGHSNALNEALAVGVPVVATKTVNFDELESAGAGFLVSSTADAVAAAVTRLLESPEMSAAMRSAAQRYVEEHLAWPRIAEQIVAVYREILSVS